MTMQVAKWAVIGAGLLLSACQPGGDSAPSGSPSSAAPFTGLGGQETLYFSGTEPFWGGSVTGTALVYTTPETPAGHQLTVTRFDGNNGISFSGTLGGKPFVLAAANGQCSDGMSDRTYPFTVTLQVSGDQRSGCAWTDRRKFSGGE